MSVKGKTRRRVQWFWSGPDRVTITVRESGSLGTTSVQLTAKEYDKIAKGREGVKA